MKLASFRTADGTSWGAVRDGEIVLGPTHLGRGLPTVRSVLEQDALAAVAAYVDSAEATLSLDEVELLPPVPDAGKILCAGVNYTNHRLESGLDPRPEYPTIFIRFPDSQVGAGNTIRRPVGVQSLDYEGEIAVIIGAGGYRVDAADAHALVAGYACFNDLSVREFQSQGSQWTPGKNFFGVGSFGPWMVTADEVESEDDMEIRTRVNGREVQHARLGDALFSVRELIAYVTHFTPLAPGDVLVTGTPGGVGFAMDPPLFLDPGDVVEVEVTGIGSLRNEIAAEEIVAPGAGVAVETKDSVS